jgi:type I restriction enzyme S subunit
VSAEGTLVRLDAVAEVRLGRQRSPKNHSGTNMLPYLRAANVTASGLALDDVKTMHFTAAEAEVFRLRRGDVLVSEASGSAGEVGKSAVWQEDIKGTVCFQNTLLRVRCGPRVLPDYVQLALEAERLQGNFARASQGVGIHHLTSGRLAALPLFLPGLAEQGRIVAELAERFDDLLGVQGQMSALRRRNEALLLRALTSMTTAEDHWRATTLGMEAKSIRNGIFVSRPGRNAEGAAILRIGAVRPLVLRLDDLRYSAMSPDDPRVAPHLLGAGDLLFTRYNGNRDYVGACAVVPALHQPITYPDKLVRAQLRTEQVDPLFVAVACSVGDARSHVERRIKTTAGQTGINGSDLKSIPLMLPDLRRQAELAFRMREVLDAHALHEKALERCLGLSTGLRTALLMKFIPPHSTRRVLAA